MSLLHLATLWRSRSIRSTSKPAVAPLQQVDGKEPGSSGATMPAASWLCISLRFGRKAKHSLAARRAARPHRADLSMMGWTGDAIVRLSDDANVRIPRSSDYASLIEPTCRRVPAGKTPAPACLSHLS